MSMSISTRIAKRLIEQFDHEPELKARIAQALLEIDDEQCVKSLIDRSGVWVRKF